MSTPLAQTVATNGYALIPRHRPDLSTTEAVTLLGSPLTLTGFSTVQELRPHQATDVAPNTYSGNFGVGEFPMHTDLAHWAVPPRYLVLRCIQGASEVATGVIDGNTLIEDLGSTLLRRTLVQPRRPLGNGKQLLRLLDRFDDFDAPVLRWDSIYLRPATAESEATFILVSKHIASMARDDVVLLAPGDTLVVDNWRMVHRRSPVPATATNRHIDRVYVGALH
jgi:L-asparagine oxygenase